MELLTGLTGVLVGALIQFYLNKRSSSEARYLELKSEACMDYLNAVAASALSSSGAGKDFAAAKTRLCVVGDKSIIEKAVALEHTSLELSKKDAQEALVSLVQEMRKRGIAIGDATEAEIQTLLFGVSTRSFSWSTPQLSSGVARKRRRTGME